MLPFTNHVDRTALCLARMMPFNAKTAISFVDGLECGSFEVSWGSTPITVKMTYYILNRLDQPGVIVEP